MSKLHEIPILVIDEGSQGLAGPNHAAVLAIVHEIEAKIDALRSDAQESSIDLRWLMAAPDDLELLREILGCGEVAATVTTVGASLVQETAVPCVWWISHRDYDASSLGEFIEITELPELLRSDLGVIDRRLAELRSRCAELKPVAPQSPPPPMQA